MQDEINISQHQDQQSGSSIQSATQNQSQTVIVQNIIGCDEAKVRSLMQESYEIIDKISESQQVAWKRELNFENTCLERLSKLEKFIESFSDPAFVKSLRKAQSSAICTDKESDYKLLSDLLAQRIKSKGDRKSVLSVNKALEVVDQLSPDALLGLTMYFVASCLHVVAQDVEFIADGLERLYSKTLNGNELPEGSRWIEHLGILDAFRISSVGELRKVDVTIPQTYPKALVMGIRRDSEEHKKACELIKTIGYNPEDVLFDNPIKSGNVVLRFLYKSIDTPESVLYHDANGNLMTIPCWESSVEAIVNQITALYTPPTDKKDLEKKFMEELRKRPTVNKVFNWMNQLSPAFTITEVGKILASVNANRDNPKVEPIKLA